MTYTQILSSIPCTGADLVSYTGENRDSTDAEKLVYKQVLRLLENQSILANYQGSVGASDTEMWFNTFLGTQFLPGSGRLPPVSPRQIRLELLSRNLLTTVVAMVNAAGESAQIEWDYATSYEIDHPLVVQLATALSLDLVDFWEAALTR